MHAVKFQCPCVELASGDAEAEGEGSGEGEPREAEPVALGSAAVAPGVVRLEGGGEGEVLALELARALPTTAVATLENVEIE